MDLTEENILQKENLTILMTELVNQPFYSEMPEEQQMAFISYQDALIKFIVFNSVKTTMDLMNNLPNSDLIYKDDQ